MNYVISISSNYNAEENIARAKEILSKEFSNVRFSSSVNTDPVGNGYPDMKYTNSAVSLHSPLTPEQLDSFLKSIEVKLGRTCELRLKKIVPIDLDIIIIDKHIVHKDYKRFPFLRRLIAEIRPFI